jgi:hypothetical protein
LSDFAGQLVHTGWLKPAWMVNNFPLRRRGTAMPTSCHGILLHAGLERSVNNSVDNKQ